MPAHKLYENAGTAAMQRRHDCKGWESRAAQGGRRQRWKQATRGLQCQRHKTGHYQLEYLLNKFKEISQGCRALSTYVNDIYVPPACVWSPECYHLKLWRRQQGRRWLLHPCLQEKAWGGSHVPTPALRNLKCLPRHCMPCHAARSLSTQSGCEKGQPCSH